MKYKKLLSTLQGSKDHTLPAVALVAGLAIGAALGILFAPKKGKDTRDTITDATAEFTDLVMKKFKEAKDKILNSEKITEIKEQAVESAWEKARDVADHLKGPEDQAIDPTIINVSSAGTSAWKENG
ncbi:YtxH domain-containing protein [Pedobacter metabolipauper]|nr:YtxH domain-containing protein [Pedobacter metabolipauper]